VAELLLNPEAWTPVTGTPDVMLRKGAAGSRFTNSATMPAPAALARVIPLLPDRPGMPMMPRKPELAPQDHRLAIHAAVDVGSNNNVAMQLIVGGSLSHRFFGRVLEVYDAQAVASKRHS
jgi:hypothetical protein